MTGGPHGLLRQRVVVAGNQKQRGMLTGVPLQRPCKPFPEVRRRFGIVEYITDAKYRIHRVAACDVKNPRDDIHTRTRQLFLSLFRKRRKASPEVPVGSVQQPQHDFSGFGATIWNVTWKSRVRSEEHTLNSSHANTSKAVS